MTQAKRMIQKEIDRLNLEIEIKVDMIKALRADLYRVTSTGYRLDPVTQLPVWYDKKKEAKDKRKRRTK